MMSASVRLGTGLFLVVGAVQVSTARADLQLGSGGWKGAQILCCGGGLLCSEEVVFQSAALASACPGSVYQVTVQTTANGQLPFTQPQCNESADLLLRCLTGDVLLGTVPDWNGCGSKMTGGFAGPFPVVVAPGCDRVVVRHAGAGHCAGRDRFWLRALSLSVGGPPPEVCNGEDDDCDGLVDEGLSCGPPAPTIGLLSPSDGGVLNLASAACAQGSGPCVLDVAGVATNADGSTATLTVDCGAGLTEFLAPVSGQSVTWAGVSLLDQAICSLDAHVSTAGGTAGAAPVSVLVDRVAPVVHAIARPTGDVLGPTDDENPVLPGLQKTVSVSVSGAQAGQSIEVRIVPAGAPLNGPPTLSAPLGVAAPDGVPGTVVVGVWTISEPGSWTVEARLADAAGNGDSLLRVVSANPSGQVVSIVSPPAPPAGPCASAADCGAGVCWLGSCHVPWGIVSPKQLQVQTTGVPVGSLVRICTDLPGAVGPACATPGTVQVGAGALAATAILVDASGAPDGAQTFVAEAQVVPGVDAWAASTGAGSTFQSRRVLLDTVAPVVQAIACPSDSLPPTGVLSQAEQGAPGTFAFAVSATDGGAPFDGAGQLWVNGQLRESFPVTGGVGTSALVFATDGTKDVRAVVFDTVGNASLPPSSPLSLPSLWQVKVAPLSLTFLAPTSSPVLSGAPLDVRLLASEAGATVRLHDGGVLVGDTITGADHEAVFPHEAWGALSDGEHALAAELEDFAGNTAVAVTLPASILVDATPPDVAILAPGADLVDGDDALPSKGGFQAEVVVSTAGADSWELLVRSGCAPDWSGCGAAILGASGPASGGPEAPVALTLIAPAAESWHRIEARARDAAGNVSTATRDVHLTLSACVLALVGLPADGAIRMADCAEPGCATVSRTLLAQWVGPCGDVDLVTLLEDGAPIGQAVPADHEAAFPVVFAHGAVTALWAEATIGGAPAAETAPFEVRVDLVPPEVDFVAADLGGFPAPASGAVVVWGAASDRAPGSTTSLEGHLRVTMSDDGGGGLLSLSAGGLPLATPISLPVLPGSHDFLWVSLPDQATHTVTVTAEDGVGNTSSVSFTATVDLSAPEEVALEPITALDVIPRLPAVTLRWRPPASNTGVPGGPAASYEVRYARAPISSEDDWDAACLATDLPLAPVMPVPGDPLGSLDAVTLRGPDSRSVNATACKWSALADGMWWFAVRATDAAGNASPVSGGGTAGTDLATLRTARITHSFSPPAGFPERLDSVVVAVGDVNGDGLPDLALGGGDMSGFCLVFGRDGGGAALPDINLDASEGDGWQCILDPGLTGAGTPVANVGDLNGDGLDDLAVGAGVKVGEPLSAEEVRIYLGSAGAPLDATPAAIVRGTSNNAIYGMKSLAGARFTGGVNGVTGLPLHDLVVPSGLENRVYVLPGSAALEPGASTVIDLTDAVHRDAWSVLTVAVVGVQASAYVGWSLASPGDVVGDGRDDLAIAQAKGPAQVIVLAGRAVDGATTVSLSGPGDGSQPGDEGAVRLLPELGVGTNSFGDSMDGSADLDGGGKRDLVINHAYASATVGRVYVFRGEVLAGHVGGTVKVQPAGPIAPDGAQVGANGVLIHRKQALPVAVGDFDGAWPGEPSTIDLAWGVSGASSFGPVTVRFNHTPGPAGLPQGSFPSDDLRLTDPFSDPPGLLFGAMIAPVGDFDGDGAPDLAVGTAGQGWVVVVH